MLNNGREITNITELQVVFFEKTGVDILDILYESVLGIQGQRQFSIDMFRTDINASVSAENLSNLIFKQLNKQEIDSIVDILNEAESRQKKTKVSKKLEFNKNELTKLVQALTTIYFRYGMENNLPVFKVCITAKNANQQNILHLLASTPYHPSSSFTTFIDKGVDKSAQDVFEKTPLHYAVIQGLSKDIIKLLAKDNSKINALDNQGKTALQYAIELNQKIAADILMKNGANFSENDINNFIKKYSSNLPELPTTLNASNESDHLLKLAEHFTDAFLNKKISSQEQELKHSNPAEYLKKCKKHQIGDKVYKSTAYVYFLQKLKAEIPKNKNVNKTELYKTLSSTCKGEISEIHKDLIEQLKTICEWIICSDEKHFPDINLRIKLLNNLYIIYNKDYNSKVEELSPLTFLSFSKAFEDQTLNQLKELLKQISSNKKCSNSINNLKATFRQYFLQLVDNDNLNDFVTLNVVVNYLKDELPKELFADQEQEQNTPNSSLTESISQLTESLTKMHVA